MYTYVLLNAKVSNGSHLSDSHCPLGINSLPERFDYTPPQWSKQAIGPWNTSDPFRSSMGKYQISSV